jgi:hypothetical protein
MSTTNYILGRPASSINTNATNGYAWPLAAPPTTPPTTPLLVATLDGTSAEIGSGSKFAGQNAKDIARYGAVNINHSHVVLASAATRHSSEIGHKPKASTGDFANRAAASRNAASPFSASVPSSNRPR